jgi:hypothetical protein
MTPFISKKHILLILEPIRAIFVTLNALNVELQNIFAEIQQSDDQRS